MATFPTALASFSDPTSSNFLNSPSHSTNHAKENDEIVAIETKIGINSSSDNTTIDYKLSGIPAADKAVSLTGTETFTNKRITKRIQSASDANAITPTGDSADIVKQNTTQAGGTLTINAPTGTPTQGQIIILRIKSTNTQTYSWNGIYRGSNDIALPTSHTGSSKTDYLGFIYNSDDSTWDLVAITKGF